MTRKSLPLLICCTALLLASCTQTPDPTSTTDHALPANSPYAGGKQYPWIDRLDTAVPDPYAAGRSYPWASPVVGSGLKSQDLNSGKTFLSDLPWTSANNGWGPVERDRSNGEQGSGDGIPMNIGGRTFGKGLGVHANSEIRYALGGQCNLFTAFVGLDQEVGKRGSVEFRVFGDGKLIFASGVRRGGDPSFPVDVSVAGVRELRLMVSDAGDNNYYDHANWAEAAVNCVAAQPSGEVFLSDLPYTSATNGWGPVEFDQSNGEQGQFDGKPLTIGGQVFAKGMGVHASATGASTLTYNLAGKCTTFATKLGIDDEVGNRGSVVFQVFGDGQKLYDSGVLRGSDADRSASIGVSGVRVLKLVVTDGGDNIDYDHADWADAVLRGCGVASVPPPAPPPVPPPSPQPPTPEASTALRLNLGGPAQAVGGTLWSGCAAYNACQGWVRGGFTYAEPDATIAGVNSPANADLYRSEWTGGASQGVPAGASAFSLHVPVSNGKYQVRLHFAELNKTAVGLRIFDVKLENTTVLQNFDVFREAGGLDRAIVRSFEVDVQDGAVDLDFIRRVENAKLSALEILPLAASPVPTPPPAPTPPPVPAPPAPTPPPTLLSWTTRAPSPTTLYEGQGAAVGGKLYVFGGFDKNVRYVPIATRAASVYDPVANRWTQLRDIPDFVTHAGVAVDDQSVYLAGGFLGNHPGPQTDHVWRYDVASDTWNALPALPAARGGGALVRLGRELHFFGGVDRDARGRYLNDHGDHWVLNLDGPGTSGTGSWRTVAPMPNPRNHLAGAAMNGLIYAIGGQHLGDEENGDQSEVNVYDTATNTWRTVSPLPIPLGHITSSVFGWRGQIIVAGGVTLGERESAQVFAYDPVTNRWSTLTALPGPRQSPVADVIGDTLVVAAGATSAGPTDTTFVSR